MTGGLQILRILTREGATVFRLLSPVKANPPPEGCPQPHRYTPEPCLNCNDSDCGLLSILVLRGVIFISSFHAVVAVAKALPVTLIPEENAVSSVGLDMIDIGRLDVAPLLQALHTQRVRLKVTLACLVPCCSVAAASSGACVLRMEETVLVAVLDAVGHERRTAGMTAWCLWSAWHCLHLRFRGFYKSLYYIAFQRGVSVVSIKISQRKIYKSLTAPT